MLPLPISGYLAPNVDCGEQHQSLVPWIIRRARIRRFLRCFLSICVFLLVPSLQINLSTTIAFKFAVKREESRIVLGSTLWALDGHAASL